MSLRAVCEVLLYFESFKNWDLNDQGVYLVKARLEKDPKHSEQRQLASPYHMLNIRKELISRKKNKIRGESSIDDTQYRCKAFLIKYNDEEIDLDEAVIFRIELDTFPELDSEGLTLVFDLYFAMEFYFHSSDGEKSMDFTKVATAKLKLNNIENGFAQFSSVGFGEYYRGNINVSVFSILMDYKFRIYRCPRLDKTPKEIAREKIENLTGYYQWLWKYTGLTPQQFYNNTVKHIRYHSHHACLQWSKAISTSMEVKLRLPKYCMPNHTDDSALEDVDEQTFSQYLGSYQITEFDAGRLQQELQGILIETYTFFQDFIKRLESDQLKKHMLRDKYRQTMKEKCGEFIFRQQIKEEDLTSEKLSGKEKRSIAKKIRKSKYPESEGCNLEDVKDFPKRTEQPIIFHEISCLQPKTIAESNRKNTLFVLSHGFQGSSYDMLNVKSMIKQFYPKAYYLVARSNEGQTEGDVFKMGERLAKQIHRFIADEEISKDLQINMVGHSMGGLILRAALPFLTDYNDCLGTFMTFGSPHLGYLQGIKTMIKTGLWFIKSWNKTCSLEQLTMADHKNLLQTALYRLSKLGSLKNFRTVVLLSSYEDSYTPWHSARIHNYRKTAQDQKSIVEKNMVHNILEGGRLQTIHRVDVSFEIVETNVDSVIGRTAHMRFLTDENVLRMILYCMPDLFR